jgi:signal transduction histidine kinase
VATGSLNTQPADYAIRTFGGRYAQAARFAALAIITATVFIGQPHPEWTGQGLVILIGLVVTMGSQAVNTVAPAAPWALGRHVIAAVSCGVLLGYDPGVGTAILIIFVGLDVGAGLPLAPAGFVTALAVVVSVIANLAAGEPTSDVTVGSVVIIGYLTSSGRKQYMLRAEEAELRLADVERAREEHARAAGLAERANAAREIHDILAHSLGALVLQLDALDAVLSTEAEPNARVITILSRARALAVEGLSEARQAVGTLRNDPPPLVDTLRQLVELTEMATLEIVGTPRPTSAEVSVALRRTAQEGLTNAAKHAPGSSTTVQLDFSGTDVILTVKDTGAPEGIEPGALADIGGGYGLEGLHERAELIGASLTSGPLGRGWQIRLRVPNDNAEGSPVNRDG